MFNELFPLENAARERSWSAWFRALEVILQGTVSDLILARLARNLERLGFPLRDPPDNAQHAAVALHSLRWTASKKYDEAEDEETVEILKMVQRDLIEAVRKTGERTR
jgi:hypothetical protein